MSGSDAMLQWEEEMLWSTWHEFRDTFGRKLKAIGKLLRYTRPEATTAGPHNGADEISASTWKIRYTAHLIWSGIMLRGILHESVTAMLQRTNQREWAAGKKKKDLFAEKTLILLGLFGRVIDHVNQVIKHIEQILALDELWPEVFPSQIRDSVALLWVHKSAHWKVFHPGGCWWRTLPTVPFGDLKLADNEAWCTICVHILNCVSKGRISRTGHIGLSLANGLWMLLMHIRLPD